MRGFPGSPCLLWLLLLALPAHASGRRVSTLRPGRGLDSHNAVTRFLGLRSDSVIGSRLPDTAFTQYGGMIRINGSSSVNSQWSAHYSRGQLDGGRRYDQLLGGDGNLVADLRNLMLDLAYVKYNRSRLGPDDRLRATGETLSQVQDRVLGPGIERTPLFQAVPGYITFGLRFGVAMGERHDFLAHFSNIGDRNYRGVSWGIDAPGRSLGLRCRISW